MYPLCIFFFSSDTSSVRLSRTFVAIVSSPGFNCSMCFLDDMQVNEIKLKEEKPGLELSFCRETWMTDAHIFLIFLLQYFILSPQNFFSTLKSLILFPKRTASSMSFTWKSMKNLCLFHLLCDCIEIDVEIDCRLNLNSHPLWNERTHWVKV